MVIYRWLEFDYEDVISLKGLTAERELYSSKGGCLKQVISLPIRQAYHSQITGGKEKWFNYDLYVESKS